MAGQKRSHVLQAEIALDERLAEIPDRSHHRDTTPSNAAFGSGPWVDVAGDEDGADDREHRPADQALPGLLRAHLGREQVTPEPSAGDQGARRRSGRPAMIAPRRTPHRGGRGIGSGRAATRRTTRAPRPRRTRRPWRPCPRQASPRSTPIRYQSIVPTEQQDRHERDRRRALGVYARPLSPTVATSPSNVADRRPERRSVPYASAAQRVTTTVARTTVTGPGPPTWRAGQTPRRRRPWLWPATCSAPIHRRTAGRRGEECGRRVKRRPGRVRLGLGYRFCRQRLPPPPVTRSALRLCRSGRTPTFRTDELIVVTGPEGTGSIEPRWSALPRCHLRRRAQSRRDPRRRR